MNISSAQPDYSTTSTDNITISNTGSSYSTDTITIDLSSALTTSVSSINVGTITLNGSGASGTYTIGSVSSDYTSSWIAPAEWQNCFPEWGRIKKMCDQYPGMKIAFEKFKTTYELVKEDFDAPPNKRIKP